MPAFRPPFDVTRVVVTDARITLPDRYAQPPPVAVGRYDGAAIELMRLAPIASATSFAWSWPATCAVRRIDLSPADAAALGIAQLIELSPLPFAIAATLRALPPGAPTLFAGLVGAALPADDTTVSVGDAPITVTGAVFGAVFQDRVALAPWAWIDLIGDALALGSPADEAAWRTLATLYADRRTIRVLGPQGRPLPGQQFRVRFVSATGATPPQTFTSDATGALPAAAVAAAGSSTELVWQPAQRPDDDRTLPVAAFYEGALGLLPAFPAAQAARAIPVDGERALVLPAGRARSHIQLLELTDWLAPPSVPPAFGPERFYPHSHLEPLVDGIAAFGRLYDDLVACAVAGGGAHLAGWHFDDVTLVPGDPSSTLTSLIQRIRGAGPAPLGDVRLLCSQFVQLAPGAAADLSIDALLALGVLYAVGETGVVVSAMHGTTNGWGLVGWEALVLLAILGWDLLVGPDHLEDTLHKAIEETKPDFFDKLNTWPFEPTRIALRSAHPARIEDNPIHTDISIPLPTGSRPLSAICDRFGIFHTKMQVVRRRASAGGAAADGFEYVGYVGGIDINANRLQSPGHSGPGFLAPTQVGPAGAAAFHDVHARLRGPAVSELCDHFNDRYTYDRDTLLATPGAPPAASVPGPVFAAPADTTLPRAGDHLVQIGRTGFGPGPGGTGFPWAPGGERTTYDTLMRAIASAREYIYIEDQYMLPDNAYAQALVRAADTCQRLVVLVPDEVSDPPFADDRRRPLFRALVEGWPAHGLAGWGPRAQIGAALRRPVLAPAERTASIGRLTLFEQVATADETQIFVGPPTRVPEAPFFGWIDGEMFYARSRTLTNAPDGRAAYQLIVLRGGTTAGRPWCPHPRPHKKAAPVTLSHPKGVYQHAKIMMVDDVFVAIGSTNINRRGLFHDGEITAFAVPSRLRAAADNPARALRCALWAEHLGLPPAQGAALLGDPIAAFELFRRSRYAGNRFTQFGEFDLRSGDYLPSIATLMTQFPFNLMPVPVQAIVMSTLSTFIQLEKRAVFNTVADQTSHIDPHPVEGPDLQ